MSNLKNMYMGQVNSPITTLVSNISSTDTTITVLNGAVLPDAPNIAVIGTGVDSETILYMSKSVNTLSNVIRGFEGVAKAWQKDEAIARNFTAYDYNTLKDNIEFLDNNKVSNDRVLSDVPADANFTDTITTINGKTGKITKDDIVALGIPAQDTNTTYSEISTAEIDAGTASTLRTITGRRIGYIIGKVSDMISSAISSLTKSDVGLSNVTNVKQMPISGGVLENYREKLITLSGTSTTINLNNGNVFAHTLSGNTTYSISNAVSGQAHSFTLIINQSSTAYTITFPASVKWQGGKIPDMSTVNKTYILTFVTVNGGTTWFGMFGGEF
jgi:hypothetical protein